ncbi:MAG: type VI secretion system ATPase TssH [Deltaproteobacteria bacterium]|jgi:type VI secretion system protein VasG|nr:type VI secretion system ATPase TssH [Deltaproteobacteria bacterium]
MISSDIRSLIRRLNTFSTQILYEAGGLAISRANYEVAVEHFFLKALEDKNSDVSLTLDHFKLDRAAVVRHLNGSLEHFTTGNTARPTFSPVLVDLLEAAWVVASVDLKLDVVRTGAVLLAYLRRPALYAQGGALPEISKIPKDELEKGFATLLSGSIEAGSAEAAEGEVGTAAAAGSGESFIAKFCENFTAKAAKGGLDPVFGRDVEIRSMIDILARRRKNNPILVGEPGVGKTAVVEGLAMRICEGDVPEILKGVTLLGLDLGLLEAGASLKGEFERRLKGVIDEIKASAKPIVLFIDEAHMLVGAGGQSGGSDAANLLKPVLARGELRTCAATTWKEYKKYFEKDPALARRFQLVSLAEPDVDTTVLILRGLKNAYEKSHGTLIRDEALVAAAEMSDRYVSGRFLPDKAIDLLDTACARVKVGLAAKPAALEDVQRSRQAVERERGGLERDSAGGLPADPARLQALALKLEELAGREQELAAEWLKQKTTAEALIAARAAYLEAAGQAVVQPSASAAATEVSTAEAGATADPQAALATLNQARAAFESIQGDGRLLDVEVTQEAVARVVSDWTGIPLGRIAARQAELVADLENRLGERIKGQGEAVAAIAQVVKASKAGLKDPAQPLGVFLLNGPSGVGKTETGLTLAELLFGDSRSVVTVNMSEFQEKHTVSRLVGSPPGYVGYGEGGLLTEAVRQRPYSVVLLDEVEKAHVDVMNLFYQVFDKGVLTDGEGKKVSFSNTIILLTSNLASDVTESLLSIKPQTSLKELVEAVRPALTAHFQPALLARMTIVPYRSLDAEAMKLIARQKLELLRTRTAANNGIELDFSDEVVGAVAERCSTVETGARNIDNILAAEVMPSMAQLILERMASGRPAPKILRLLLDGRTLQLVEGDEIAPGSEASEGADGPAETAPDDDGEFKS